MANPRYTQPDVLTQIRGALAADSELPAVALPHFLSMEEFLAL